VLRQNNVVGESVQSAEAKQCGGKISAKC